MPEIRAIHGLRYDLGHIGSLAEVISPPAAEISAEKLDELYQRHPANVARVLTNRAEVGDDDSSNRFTRAARFITDWQRQGVLQKDPDPAIYVYHQEFEQQGEMVTRRGFFAGLVLPEFSKSIEKETVFNIVGGEEALKQLIEDNSTPNEDLKLLQLTHTNVQPSIRIYADSQMKVQRILDQAISNLTPLVAKDEFGVIHRLWPVTDHMVIAEVREAMAHCPAQKLSQDHEYYTAMIYLDLLLDQASLPSNHPARCVLTAFFGSNEPGIKNQPQLPVYRSTPHLTSGELAGEVHPFFECHNFGKGMGVAEQLWQELNTQEDFGRFGLYCAADDQWVIASLTEDGLIWVDEQFPEQSDTWKYQNHTLLSLLIVKLLNTPKPGADYSRNVDTLVEQLKLTEPTKPTMAALVVPPNIHQIESLWGSEISISAALDINPQPVCGLVFNPLK